MRWLNKSFAVTFLKPSSLVYSKYNYRHFGFYSVFSSKSSMMSTTPIPKVKLNNGNEIPIFGLGTWKAKPGEVEEAVKNAIDVGYRHLDCAIIYGNEPEVGNGIKAKINEGKINREDLWITSKLWDTYHRPDLVQVGIKETLKNLGVEYLDLYLIHWPMGLKEGGELIPKKDGKAEVSDVDYVDTWKAMEELVDLGLTKSIGISNFNKNQVERVLSSCKIVPAMNQIEVHPYLTQRKLVDFCKSKGIAITGYSPLCGNDRPWAGPDDPMLVAEPALMKIGKKYGKSAAQVALRWLIQREIIAIPKSVRKERLAENINIFDFKLSDEDMEVVYSLERNGRTCLDDWLSDHKHYPFHDKY